MYNQDKILELTDIVRETAFALYKYLGYGHLEKVYENGLVHRLTRKGYHVKQQHPLKVWDEDNTLLGQYTADLFIENILMVELKSCRILATSHYRQNLGYLRASKIKHGLLINFGTPKLETKKLIL